ncbi:hypothetical protein [Nocardia mexicana]|uniref:hypothetical protein n=1 Tax=Nocardia mexicana TaxID=279262 RepID=UPI0011C0550F|nr:hypothetical protein [Nocardia mexicana]
MHIFKRVAASLSLAAVTILTDSLLTAGLANAASSPIEACGGGYHEIDHRDIPGARIHLLYNGKTNCVVTWKTKDIGHATYTQAIVSFTGGRGTVNDTNHYKYYAGPVKIDAPGECIEWGGATGFRESEGWRSRPSHCG